MEVGATKFFRAPLIDIINNLSDPCLIDLPRLLFTKPLFPGVFVVKFNLWALNHGCCACHGLGLSSRRQIAVAGKHGGKAKVFVKRKSRGRRFADTIAGRIKKRFKRRGGI